MSFALTRILAYFTFVSYLLVATIAVRFAAPEMATIVIDSHYLTYLSNTEIQTAKVEVIEPVEMEFAEIKIPEPKIDRPVVIARKFVAKVEAPKIVAVSELPFHEPVVIAVVEFNNELMTDLVALYQDVKGESSKTLVAETKSEEIKAEETKDEVSTAQAAPAVADAEPEFFEYPIEDEKVEPVAAAAPQVDDIQTASQFKEAQKVEPAIAVSEEVAVDDLVAFDYSKVQGGIANNTVPTVSAVTTQPAPTTPRPEVTPQVANPAQDQKPSGRNALVGTQTYPIEMSIQATSTDLKSSRSENALELRFMDDQNEMLQDSGDGNIIIRETLSQPTTTRSVNLVKMGFVHTHTDLILEDDTSISLPLLDLDTYNEYMQPFEGDGPIGAVLVELEDSTELAQLDVPFGKVVMLDGDLRLTEKDDFRYQLFLGVKAGNALLTYKGFDRNSVSKIIHVHEDSMTYESNIFEKVSNEKVVLLEEDLLSREKAPLIISEDQVKIFATNKTSKKINDHTYQMDFSNSLAATRRYLELSHQDEPVFVGIRQMNKVLVPSESFMRHILSNLDNSKLANRCVVQVNLRKKVSKVDVDSESIESSVETYAQMLDTDGKFYDSASDKTRKIIVVGENQGSEKISQDAKINIKITYQDESVEFLGSYCSPNTYLVEQL